MKTIDPGELQITVEQGAGSSGELTLARVTGDVDLANVDKLEQAIGSADGGIVIDLTGVPFMDSSGLRVLLIEAQERNLGLVLQPGSPVLRLFEMAEVTGRIQCFRSEREALDAIEAMKRRDG